MVQFDVTPTARINRTCTISESDFTLRAKLVARNPHLGQPLPLFLPKTGVTTVKVVSTEPSAPAPIPTFTLPPIIGVPSVSNPVYPLAPPDGPRPAVPPTSTKGPPKLQMLLPLDAPPLRPKEPLIPVLTAPPIPSFRYEPIFPLSSMTIPPPN